MKKGFTLVELMVAVSIFIVIMTVSTGSIIGVFDANRKSRSLKTVINNLNLAVESMSREIRFGKDYHCGSSGNLINPQNCSSGDTFLSFLSKDGDRITYRLDSSTIEKRVGSVGSDWIAITAPEIIITNLAFFVLGTDPYPDTLQPKVIIGIKGYAGATSKGQSEFALQTLVSQRALDI